ncbi:response regulator transcription factor [Planosporangium flavigriseum]|uniref:DNA-binding response regulator n=1 Tax=Planosporangium flavigriseum TaxID=373681 RepID=A0A8J3LMK6_9ACTN|nr:response regulator transcription factor [Planosporangium flavigriseum]NJC67103.1 response regulator transcription factor [Planosporangium flavigriseum]GIG75507.1 DNA-binding response regulator [Planosporangium flavigriseum]
MRVLVVNDEPGVRESVSGALRFAGYEVSVASDGAAALNLVRAEHPDAVVLDFVLPNMDGLEICRRLRAEGHQLLVLMLAARDRTPDRSAGLIAGVDDYLVKPFALTELLARLQALVQRPPPADGLTLHPAGRLLRRAGREVALTPTECRIAAALLANPGQPLGRTGLLHQVWGYDFGGRSAILDPYLASLDRKLAALGCRLAHTSDGYVLT